MRGGGDSKQSYWHHFKGKTIFCNCDDPLESEFWKYFHRNFSSIGLKKLISTHYEKEECVSSYALIYNGANAEKSCQQTLVDRNGDPNIYDEKIRLKGNGDFRSPECVKFLQEADIVVTNPPFSLFREYVQQLIDYKKQFLIIGNQNALTYKEIFPLIKENKIWIGYGFNAKTFIAPSDYIGNCVEKDGKKYVTMGNTCWYTNLDIPKRHEPLWLKAHYSPEAYPKYDNYNAIEVSKVRDIPCDYDGVMGIPITFIDKFCPEQFEIVGSDAYDKTPPTKKYTSQKKKVVDGKPSKSLTGTMGCVIKRASFGKGTFFDVGYPVQAVYKRLFIRRKT